MKCNYSITVILLFLLLIFSYHQAQAQTIAFQRGDGIWISDINGQDQRFICKGYDPDISPDGKYIAFTQYEYFGKFYNLNRHIAIYEIESRKVTILKSIPSNNNFGPTWSPTGDKIAFSSFINNIWGIGIINRNNTEYHSLTETLAVHTYSPTWTSQGRYIVSHGDGNIYTLDVNGGTIGKTPYKKIVRNYGVSSVTAFTFSQDKKYFLFDADVIGESMRGLHEPPGAIFVHNTSSGITNRVTPGGICGLYPSWYSNGKIIFSGFKENDIPQTAGSSGIATRIYTIDITGNGIKALIENASDPSISVK